MNACSFSSWQYTSHKMNSSQETALAHKLVQLEVRQNVPKALPPKTHLEQHIGMALNHPHGHHNNFEKVKLYSVSFLPNQDL